MLAQWWWRCCWRYSVGDPVKKTEHYSHNLVVLLLFAACRATFIDQKTRRYCGIETVEGGRCCYSGSGVIIRWWWLRPDEAVDPRQILDTLTGIACRLQLFVWLLFDTCRTASTFLQPDYWWVLILLFSSDYCWTSGTLPGFCWQTLFLLEENVPICWPPFVMLLANYCSAPLQQQRGMPKTDPGLGLHFCWSYWWRYCCWVLMATIPHCWITVVFIHLPYYAHTGIPDIPPPQVVVPDPTGVIPGSACVGHLILINSVVIASIMIPLWCRLSSIDWRWLCWTGDLFGGRPLFGTNYPLWPWWPLPRWLYCMPQLACALAFTVVPRCSIVDVIILLPLPGGDDPMTDDRYCWYCCYRYLDCSQRAYTLSHYLAYP